MSTSRVINRWLNRVYKSIAILLVLFAVLISALRLFLPYAHNYKDNLQNFINSSNNSHITIGKLSMEWQKLGPSIVLNQVSLLETQSTDIFIDKIHVHVDFWQSLAQGQVITQDVTLDGANVLIKNFTTPKATADKDAPLIDRVAEIFLDRIGRFSLLNSKIVFQTNETEKLLWVNQLDWLNKGDSHRGKGYVVVDGLTSNNIKVILDLHGDTMEELDGQVYLQANQLNITPWLDKILAIDNQNTHSAVNFDGWLTVSNGFPTQLQVSLGKNEISWTHQKNNQFFSINQGHILTRFTKQTDNRGLKALNIMSSPLTFITHKNIWQPMQFQLSKERGILQGYISKIGMEGLTDISPLFFNDEKFNQTLLNIQPAGYINDLFLQVSPNKKALVANIESFNSHPYHAIPGVSNLAGQLVMQDNFAQLSLVADKGSFDFAEHFEKPIPYNNFSTDITLNFAEDSWQIASNNIEFSSEELTLSAGITIEKPQNQQLRMSLLASVINGNAEWARHYFPLTVMTKDLVSYLNKAIVSGNVDQAQILFNGPLNKFPFNNHEGVFIVDAELNKSVFKFDPHWPAIKDFKANLHFKNNSMSITGRSGHLEGINVTGVTAKIEDLSDEQVLRVNAKVNNTAAKSVARLMNKSPLKDTVGSTLNRLAVSKPISGNFSLTLPLNEPNNAIAKGEVLFKNNRVNLQAPNMLFTQVNGRLIYENDRINTNNVKLLWRGMPLTLSVDAQDKGFFYDTNIALKADWKSKYWLKQLPSTLQKYGSGNLTWQGKLSLNMYTEGGFTYDLSINSDLNKAIFNLPLPYAKKDNVLREFNAQVTGQKHNTTINANLGKQLQFYGVLDHEKVSFSKAHLLLGTEEMLLPTHGFHITTQLVQADAKQWQPLIFDILASITSVDNLANNTPNKNIKLTADPVKNDMAQPTPLLASPERIRGEIGQLTYGDYALTNMLFNLKNNENSWLLDVNAKEVRSQITLHNNLVEKGIEVNADFVHLAKTVTPEVENNNESDEHSNTRPNIHTNINQKSSKNLAKTQHEKEVFNQQFYTQLPPLTVNCASCIIDKINLGNVNFVIERNAENHIVLKTFNAIRDKLTIGLDGFWIQSNGEDTSYFTGFIDTKDLEEETEKLGYTPTIKDSGLYSDFTFSWQASPYEFDVTKLNGQFNAKLDDGYLTEVPDQARVFSVLSLQSLVRKLSFDFRDIFSDGMFYSSIDGDFQLKDGILYTDNLFMKGAAGDLEVKGNTDLGKEQLDIRMSYKPNVTSSLPALAWIATLNPVAFLAGIALEEVITSKVYYEMNFELTGPISQPILKDVNRKTRNISVGKTTPPKILDDLTFPQASEAKNNNAEKNSEQITLPKKSRVDG